MSQLTDAINAAGPAQVAAAIANDPTFTVFNLLWSEPQEIAPACDKMGWTTLEQLLDWVRGTATAIGNTQAFEALIDPVVPVDYATLKVAPWPKLHESIHATGLLAADCMLHNSDGEYRLPTKAQWTQIAALCPASKRKHSRTEAMDCDDFARMALGWLASKGLGNCAAAFVATRHYLNTQETGGHAVVLVWDDMLTPWQWEPQTGKLHPVAYPKLGGNFLSNRVEIARIFA